MVTIKETYLRQIDLENSSIIGSESSFTLIFRHVRKSACLLLFVSSLSFGKTNEVSNSSTPTNSSPAGSSDSDKVDIKNLEDKYWSAKDDDFTVVQNRRYSKAQRYYLSLMGGVPVNDPYSAGNISGFHLGYFFNERWGMDFEILRGSLHENDASVQFTEQYHTKPSGNFMDSSQTLGVSFFPLYAKMSFLDRKIIYFDMGLSAGIGTLNYNIRKLEGDELRSASTYYLTVTQQIFFSNHFALRLDYSNRWTNENRLMYNGGSAINSPTGRDLGNKTYNDTSLLFGLTYWH